MNKILRFLLFLLFCPSVLVADEIKTDWYQYYQPINNSNAKQFVSKGIKHATQLLGKPAIPVNKIHLRFSKPLNPKFRENFQLCEITDSDKGIFTIYLSHKPEKYSFWGQLGHEIPHLINAKLYDVYFEGVNTVFSEKLLKKEGRDWNGWLKHYKSGKDPFYAATYFMMKEVWSIAGNTNMRNLLSHAVATSKTKNRMHIDIDSWLNTLPNNERNKIIKVIHSHVKPIRKSIGNKVNDYTFVIPKSYTH